MEAWERNFSSCLNLVFLEQVLRGIDQSTHLLCNSVIWRAFRVALDAKRRVDLLTIQPRHLVKIVSMWSPSPSNMDPVMEPLARQETYGRTPEARVLIVMTGGTICMQKSDDGLVPVRGFLETCMAPRREFNDGIEHEPIDVSVAENTEKKVKSLRTPKSTYGKRVRYVPTC